MQNQNTNTYPDGFFSEGWLLSLIPIQWLEILEEVWNTESFFRLSKFLANEYRHKEILPRAYNIFNCLKYIHIPCNNSKYIKNNFKRNLFTKITSSEKKLLDDYPKIVMLGQDPYYQIKETDDMIPQAHGLAFSVNDGVEIPPTLNNIYDELVTDLKIKKPTHGNLTCLSEHEGVVFLNSCLTVICGIPASHSNKIDWEIVTDAIIQTLSRRFKNIVFVLCGAEAHKKSILIDQNKHCIIMVSHPSPRSFNVGKDRFKGSKFASKANEYLKQNGREPVNWSRLNY